MPAIPPANGHLPRLDAMRGIAILFVLIGHVTARDSWLNYLGGAHVGPIIFFCLSGFLITRILLAMRDRGGPLGGNLRVFILRRSLRIFPIYFLTIACCVAVGYQPVIANLGWLLTYTVNMAPLLQSPMPNLGAASHFWSLAVEEQFYLLWPVLILALPERGLVRLAFGAVIASLLWKFGAAWLSSGKLGLVLSTRVVLGPMDALGLGALVAMSIRNGDALASLARPSVFYALVAAFLAASAYRHAVGMDPWFLRNLLFGCSYFTIVTLMSCALLVRCLTHQGRAWVLDSRALQWLGRISYGLYVYHCFVLMLGDHHITPLGMPRWLLIPLELLACVAVAALSYYLIERPILRLKNRIGVDPATTREVARAG